MPSKIINSQTSVANRNLHFRGTWAATVFIYAFQASILPENNGNQQKHAKNNPFYSQFIPKQTLSYPINSRIY
jgi:hypothetical protein